MDHRSSSRQRPLFHEGPSWHQLDEQIQQQLVERLAAICHGILAAADYCETTKQEQADVERED